MQIYLFEAESSGLYKIGVSKNAKKRLKQVQTGCPYKIKILKVYDSKYAFKIESSIHRRLKNRNLSEYEEYDIRGEWFVLNEEFIEGFISDCDSAHKGFEALESLNNPFF